MTNNVTPTPETMNLPQVPPMGNQERETNVGPDQPWSDSRALEIAKKDVAAWFQYRTSNYDRSFRRCLDTYMAMTKQKTWEGTKINRASVPIWMGVQQIESLLPHAIGALFADDYPFDCEPQPGTTLAQAVAVRDLLRSQMDNLNPDVMNMTLREIIRRSYKSDLIFGIGPIEGGWVMKQFTKQVFNRVAIPVTQNIPSPTTGQIVPIPTGEFRFQVQKGSKTYQVSRPKLSNISIWDYVFDPNCKSHNPQEGDGVAIRQLLTVNYLKSICLPELGFKLPANDAQWKELASMSKQTMAEIGKGWGEQARGNYYHAGIDQSADPGLERIEVFRYIRPDRNIWLFGREFLAYNQPNELGVINVVNPFYVDVPDRHVGLSLCDLIEGDVKLAQAIIEARIDELNLMIHPPIIRKLGVKVAASQRKLRPGVEWEAEDPTKDIQRMEMGNVTQSAYLETNALEVRVQKTTGVSDLAAIGAATSGGNSANRTATGVNAQMSATGTRMQYQVENLEDQGMQPILQLLLLLNQKYTDPNTAVLISGPNGQQKTIDPLDILNSDVKFKVKASEKLRLRRALQSGGLAEVLQFIQAAMSGLELEGVKINWTSIGQLIADAIGMPANDLFQPMTPQEMQQRMQMRMAPDLMKKQMADDRLAAQSQRQDDADETKLILELVKKLVGPEAAATILAHMGMQTPLKMLEKDQQIAAQPKQLPSGGK